MCAGGSARSGVDSGSMRLGIDFGTTQDRKSTRLNSSHTVIYTLPYTTLFRSLPRSLETFLVHVRGRIGSEWRRFGVDEAGDRLRDHARSEEHTSELQSHRDLHSSLHDALPISPALP